MLGGSLLGNMLAGKGVVRAGYGSKGKQIIRAGYGSKQSKGFSFKDFHYNTILQPHSLTNFEIQKYYQNESRFNGVYSRDNLLDKIKDAAYVINQIFMSILILELIGLLCIN